MEFSKTTEETKNYTSRYMQLGAQQGWQCPICKRVLAPFITECPCNGQGMQTVTTMTTTKIADLLKRPDLTKINVKDYEDTTITYSQCREGE